MQFALLKDEDGRHTLRVACTFDPKRWPFESGDRIVAVKPNADTLRTLSDLVTALRGRAGHVAVVVERGGSLRTLDALPALCDLVTARRGVEVDGALVAPIEFDDEASLKEPVRLAVHSVEPGSAAEMLGLDRQDMLESVDGRAFTDLESLSGYLRQRPKGKPIKIVFRRWSPSNDRIFDYHVRELPGEDVEFVGPDPNLVTMKKD